MPRSCLAMCCEGSKVDTWGSGQRNTTHVTLGEMNDRLVPGKGLQTPQSPVPYQVLEIPE